MGLFEGLQRRLAALRSADQAAELADVDMVRRALLGEAKRLGRRERLSVSQLLEHSGAELRRVDLFQIIAHLDAEGEVVNVEQDSFGNLRFDLGSLRDLDA